jgi:AraC-like DNA-binding protein
VYAVESHRCSQVAITDRAEWWSELVSSIHSRMDFRLGSAYHGRLEHQHTETYQLVRWWGDEEFIKRTGSDVRRHPHGAYELLVPVTGSMTIRQAEAELSLGPGGMALATLDAPMDMWHSGNFSCLALVIPQLRVDMRVGGAMTRTVELDAARGMGRIVADLLASLRSQAAAISGVDFDAAADRIVDLLCLAYAGATHPPAVESQGDLVATIRGFVRANAHDQSLTGATVAARLGWSLRQIQVQLQRAGTTPSALIRDQRLELARLRLQHRAWDRYGLASIARSSGFGSASTFSNAYRERFGERPSDTRERWRAHGELEPPEADRAPVRAANDPFAPSQVRRSRGA